MCNYEDVTRLVTRRFHDQIDKACSPLFDYFNLNYFCCFNVGHQGGYSYFATDLGWCDYFGDKKFYLNHPFLCDPKAVKEGVSLPKYMKNKALDYISSSGENVFGINSVLQLIYKTKHGLQAFVFSPVIADEFHITLLLNDLPLIKKFIVKMRENHPSLFSSMYDHQMDLLKLDGHVFRQKSDSEQSLSSSKNEFLKKMGIKCDVKVSPREIDVIKLLLEGWSSQQISQMISLSKRTVEHHIERIKDKFGCQSKSELVQKGRELEYLGCLG